MRRERRVRPEPPRCYVVAGVRCKCGSPQGLLAIDGRLYCKRCNTPVRLDGCERYDTREELIRRMSVPQLADDEVRRIAAERVSSLEAESSALRAEVARLKSEMEDIAIQKDGQIEELRTRLAEEQAKALEAGMRIEGLESGRSTLEREVARLEEEKSEVERTMGHYRRESEMYSSVRVREMAEAFLDFVSKDCNLVRETDDVARIREMNGVYRQRLRMSLGSCGLTVSWHEPGQTLSEGPVKLIETVTDDPSLDMKVVRCDCMGCTFRDSVYADLPETVSVYRYVPPVRPAETRLRVVEDAGEGAGQ